MIAAWMLWSIGAGLLFLVAGLAVERLLDGGHRWVWAGAGAGTVLLPAVRFLAGGGGAEAVAPATAPIQLEPLTVTVAGDSVLHSLDDTLLPGWVALSSVLVVGARGGRGRSSFLRTRRSTCGPTMSTSASSPRCCSSPSPGTRRCGSSTGAWGWLRSWTATAGS